MSTSYMLLVCRTNLNSSGLQFPSNDEVCTQNNRSSQNSGFLQFDLQTDENTKQNKLQQQLELTDISKSKIEGLNNIDKQLKKLDKNLKKYQNPNNEIYLKLNDVLNSLQTVQNLTTFTDQEIISSNVLTPTLNSQSQNSDWQVKIGTD
ncbi:hypothetical protein PPERSA_09752 [Pseudocohnilembus persalinus]|uniref:Uncharacterized protein n=1 Tax=Pseudocohnilembus persalinus TaxID=266149 RepID=A0A0V0QTF4_PSEPJ|nr:hypothetical protein PPERSA_09752 [Pseudocohnilembus persalinus]|eukprot:KRX05612.1 hypothetical protein PPERSA_09752 [Pseudocohnilembus persalinus]